MSINMIPKTIRERTLNVGDEGISIVAATRRSWQIENIVANYDRQTFSVKELIIIINNDKISKAEVEGRYFARQDISIYQLSEATSLGRCLNYGYEKTKYNYITKFDDDDYYSAYYLQEVYDAFKQLDCDIVCKSRVFYYLREYGELIVVPLVLKRIIPTISGAGATISMTRKAFQCIQYSNLRRGIDLDLFVRCRRIGLKVYSTTSYNFLCIRQKDIGAHTWQITAESLKEKADKLYGIKKMRLEKAYKEITNYPVKTYSS